ncbi:MAG: hypothetical protein RI906_563 [Pseudomonadota bacterium]|jgi:TRAP transporter TAXI family solute receptor
MRAKKTDSVEPVATVAKALATLRAFVDAQDAWGVRELAAALDMPPSTVHRLLARLRMEGFVGYDKTQQKYTIGFEFSRLSAAVIQRNSLRQAAMPVMRTLADETGESVWLALYDHDTQIAYIADAESAHSSRYIAPLGRSRPLTEDASGIAVLSALTRTARDTPRRGTGRQARTGLADEVKTVRARGYAVSRAADVSAATMISAAIKGPEGLPLGAIAVVVPLHRLGTGQDQRLGECVRQAALKISMRTGARLLGGASVGTWQDAVGIISGLLREHLPGVQLVPSMGRGGRNLLDVDARRGAYALSTASSLYDARLGRKQFNRPLSSLRSMMLLSELQLFVIIRSGLKLSGTASLAGLKVSPGEQGFSAEQGLLDALECAPTEGRRRRSRPQLIYMDYPEGRRQFEAGFIDALVWMGSDATPLVRDLEQSTASTLLPLEPQTIAAMLKLNPGYREGRIQQGAFPNWLDRDLSSIAVPTVLVCREDQPDDEVYQIVKTLYERRDTLAGLSSVYANLGPDTVLNGLTTPLHRGARRFFSEIGLRPRYAAGSRRR